MQATRIALLPFVFLGVAAAQEDKMKVWDFQSDKVDEAPAGFSFGKTGKGRPGKWVVRIDGSAPAGDHVLAQVDTDDTGDRFPVAVADAPGLKDVRLEVRCKPVSGKVDQACGLVFRYRDENNYYVTRANALEDNVRLYHVVNGRRREFAGWNGKVAGQTWHTLAVEARGNRFQVYFDGSPVMDAQDDTFQEAGKVGVWTKADSVTHFDALSAKPLG
jgi:NAD(P)H-flavin reductase